MKSGKTCNALRHRHRFHLRIIPHRIFAQFAPDAAHLESAKRRGRIKHVIAIHPDRARFQFRSYSMRSGNIERPDRRHQAVQAAIAALHYLVDVFEVAENV